MQYAKKTPKIRHCYARKQCSKRLQPKRCWNTTHATAWCKPPCPTISECWTTFAFFDSWECYLPICAKEGLWQSLLWLQATNVQTDVRPLLPVKGRIQQEGPKLWNFNTKFGKDKKPIKIRPATQNTQRVEISIRNATRRKRSGSGPLRSYIFGAYLGNTLYDAGGLFTVFLGSSSSLMLASYTPEHSRCRRNISWKENAEERGGGLPVLARKPKVWTTDWLKSVSGPLERQDWVSPSGPLRLELHFGAPKNTPSAGAGLAFSCRQFRIFLNDQQMDHTSITWRSSSPSAPLLRRNLFTTQRTHSHPSSHFQ